MPDDVSKIRTVAIVAHSGAGKTSLAEALLHKAGATGRLGSVDAGSTTSDYSEDEIERKISISASMLNLDWQGNKVYLIDTPGYADFIGEVVSSLRAVDSAVLIVCGMSGVEAGTDRVWKFLEERKLPTIILVNKLDKETSDFLKVVEQLQKSFGKKCIPLYYPVGKQANFKDAVNLLTGDLGVLAGQDKEQAEKFKENLIETIAEVDDALLEKYLDAGNLSPDEIKGAFKKAVAERKIFPVLCAAATKEIGTEPVLNAIIDYLPSPQAKPSAPFSAFVFKTISDPYVGQLSIFRVYSGALASNTGFYNGTRQIKERIGQVYILQGKEQRGVDKVIAGEIAAVTKLKETFTNDSISDEKSPVVFDQIIFPQPAISISLKPKSRQDEGKISTALSKLSGEDPTFKVGRDQQTKELIASGLGDLHLDIMINRMKKRYGVDVEVGTPKVAYKETITKKVQVQGKYKRQSGGRGQYGDVWLELEPLPKDSETDFEFVNKIVGGAVPRNYIPAVEKGVVQAMSEGIIAGYPLVDVKVTIYDGSYHEVDSSDMAFQIAGSMALKKGSLDASPVLLEPIMDVEVNVPEEYMGNITGDLNSRRGRIMGMEPKGAMQVIKAQVPLAEMLKYGSELRSITGGRGSYSMKFSHYEQVPQKIANTIISQAQAKKQEEQK